MHFRVRQGETAFVDLVHGRYAQDVDAAVGDFVVRRADGVASYQLYEALALPPPRFAHVPLLVDAEGKRLAKRDGALTIAALRAAGRSPAQVVGQLAQVSGLSDGAPVTARALVNGFSLARVRREPTAVTLP